MHALLLERAAYAPRGRSRTLTVKDGTVWLWPGVPPTVWLDGQLQAPPKPERVVDATESIRSGELSSRPTEIKALKSHREFVVFVDGKLKVVAG